MECHLDLAVFLAASIGGSSHGAIDSTGLLSQFFHCKRGDGCRRRGVEFRPKLPSLAAVQG